MLHNFVYDINQPVDDFIKVGFVEVFWIEGVTYIYRPIDGFVKVKFVEVF